MQQLKKTIDIDKQLENLIKIGFPENSEPEIFAGSLYFQHMLDSKDSDYWKSEKFSIRDEFYVILCSYFSLINTVKNIPHNNEWRLQFDVASLFQLKSNAQSVYSLDILASKNCYADALSVCRPIISRLNLLILCAFNPNLFDLWLEKPKEKIFLDGNIRRELANNKVSLPTHLYEFYSEIIHGQYQGLCEIGYFEEGLFPKIPAINNQIWTTAKFTIGMMYQAILSMAITDLEGKQIPEKLKTHQNLFEWIKNEYLPANRIDHLFTFLAEDRHAEKVGKDKYLFGRSYDFEGLTEQIKKFHKKGQRKKLSKNYNI